MASSDEGDQESQDKKPIIAKTPTELQRLKLEKLMENPDKPAPIPSRLKSKTLPPPPEFNRNVMGSSAGAGSGEFHVYRHVRRREYSRQKLILEKAEKELLDQEYHNKIEENKRKAEEKTSKKRAKRLKKKQKLKAKKADKKDNKEELQHSKENGNSDDTESSEELSE